MPMKIGELAARARVGIDTVRYYERQGLLPTPQRQASGYRRYESGDLARLQFVRRAKALGFSLADISELLALSALREADMSAMKSAALAKLADVEARLAEMTRVRDGLKHLIDACPGQGALASCPILHALAEQSP